jgi:hypothetical protein
MTDAEKREAIERAIPKLPEPYRSIVQEVWTIRTTGGESNIDDCVLVWVLQLDNRFQRCEEAKRAMAEREREIEAQKNIQTNVDYS